MSSANKKPWGGRFEAPTDKLVEAFNASVDFDKRLVLEDIAGSKAHVKMLGATGILEPEEVTQILEGLDSVLHEVESEVFPWRTELEDVHMNVETRLKELIGAVAGKLHTARSRNDQVALDFRLWVKRACIRYATGTRQTQPRLKLSPIPREFVLLLQARESQLHPAF